MGNFKEKLKLKKIIKKVKEEMMIVREKLKNVTDEKKSELVMEYNILSKRYFKLVDVLTELEIESRKKWLKSPVNVNRLNAKLRRLKDE